MLTIDYRMLSDAIDYYWQLGYTYLEVPWIVPTGACDATAPVGVRRYETLGGELVASGEQSFIAMMQDGTLPYGQYMCATPCFRDDKEDYWHVKQFLKLELIRFKPYLSENSWDPTSQMVSDDLLKTIWDAEEFFRHIGFDYKYLKEDWTTDPSSVDIRYKGVELGSYGVREYKGFRWVYGTGCALPRTSQALLIE